MPVYSHRLSCVFTLSRAQSQAVVVLCHLSRYHSLRGQQRLSLL
ncbi:hypothetical protein HMPREF0262_02605 [Clostridium sp. ATCC 29733]|nr:hypothetical protein HMPREF0262_02605 [Clostridium sp. ATCC 29733]